MRIAENRMPKLAIARLVPRWSIIRLVFAIHPIIRVAVSICVNLTQFGAATVFLLLCTKNSHFLLATQFQWNASICVLLPLICCLLWPVTMLKSPNDFWPILLGGIFCTVGTCMILGCNSIPQLIGNQIIPNLPEFIEIWPRSKRYSKAYSWFSQIRCIYHFFTK